jgi:general secretion pathway protein A
MEKMFEEAYGMENTPFSRDIPTDKLYDSQMMQVILGRLKYAAEKQLFAVLTGECSTGKTNTIRGL